MFFEGIVFLIKVYLISTTIFIEKTTCSSIISDDKFELGISFNDQFT